MVALIKAGQLLLSLSLIILLHELGHFFFARLFKTRVDKFYLFFDAWFSIFKIKRGNTEYGLGWLPLGGYCKIAGMIDESFDKEQMSKPPQPDEFRSKPTWQRLFIMLGGVMVNFVTAIMIFILTLFIWGQTFLPNENVTYGIAVDSLAVETGLQEGDKILALDNNKVEYFNDIVHDILLSTPKTIQVERNGSVIDIPFPESIIPKLVKNKKSFFITYRTPFIVDSILPGSEAENAKLQKFDRIIGVDSVSTGFYHEFKREIVKYSEKKVDIKVLRKNDTVVVPVNVPDLSKGSIGIYGVPDNKLFKYEKVKYSFLSAIPAGVNKGFSTLGDYVKQFKLVFNKETEGYKEIGGFGAIASIFPSEWNWQAFWDLTAFLSILLAFMNVLPIPALDGGHVLFLIYEMITGRKPSDKFLEYAQMIGLALVLGLVLYANGNDIFKWLAK